MNNREPHIAHSDLTGAIYVIVGNDKYEVTEQAKRAVKAVDRQLGVNWCINTLKELPPVKPTRKKCKWILYDYRTLVPREHGNIPNPYWRIPARYKTELKYCPYCGGEIDYSEVDAEIEERAKNEQVN